jgi:HSP20 family molecular chaperone IbpA
MFFATLATPQAMRPSLRTFDARLERFLNATAAAPQADKTQIDETQTGYTLRLDVPGVTKTQLHIAIEGAVVRIESLADAPRTVKMAYEFAQNLEPAGSSATLENGVLELTLLKKVAVNNAASITIN